jgi:hypothetical protein
MTKVEMGLHCPNCGRKYECPCEACNKGKHKSEWVFVDGEAERCPCGFVATLDWWTDLEQNVYEVMKKVQAEKEAIDSRRTA